VVTPTALAVNKFATGGCWLWVALRTVSGASEKWWWWWWWWWLHWKYTWM